MDNPWATLPDLPSWPPQPPPSFQTPPSPDVALHTPPDDDWATPWTATSTPEPSPAPDHWEQTRQEAEKFTRAVPPELLDSLLRRCHQVSQEIWPASEPTDDGNWRSGFEHLPDIAAPLALLAPTDSALPPPVQFSETAIANAMNEALKLTRHLPACANSPLSRLLASKGSLEWEKSIKAKKDAVPDTAHVGWRVLDKDGRVNTADDTKPRKVTGGLLSFWSRRASATQVAPVETPSERSARSSLESTKSAPHPPSSRAASPSKAPIPSIPPPPPPDSNSAVVAAPTVPSAVSRFLNRFSRAKSSQNGALALSSDDLEFLSDIVPSANDPPDEDTNDVVLDALTGASNPLPVPQRLPPPISPPPKQPTLPARPFSAIVGLGTPDGASVIGVQNANRTPNVPVLAPPPSAQSTASFSRTQTPPPHPKDVPSSTALTQRRQQPSSQSNSLPQSSFTLLPPQRVLPLLSIPPLLPPPPVSPPQTPRPGALPSRITPSLSSTTRNTDTSFHDSLDSDEEFSAFTSFPPPTRAPFPSSGSRRSPSPPSPPPRRIYERTHYPSSSSMSSILSPASRTSVDQLCSAGSCISASLDSFDDFVSSPPVVVRSENRKCTPSPPPLPIKSQSQYQKPPHTDVPFSSVHHAPTPSQTLDSPTANTSLINNAFSVSSVSVAEHQRTQSLVNQAAARGGFLWPNSPELNEPRMVAIPPPPSSSTSPKSLTGEGDFNLLDDMDSVHGGGADAWHPPPNMDVGIGVDSTVPSTGAGLFGASSSLRDAGSSGKGLGSRSQLQPSPPPLPSASLLLSFSSLGGPVSSASTSAGSQSAKPKQTGGLSAQDLSFFEGW